MLLGESAAGRVRKVELLDLALNAEKFFSLSGIRVLVIKVNEAELSIWVDAKTRLPMRIEVEKINAHRMGEKKVVMGAFAGAPRIDPTRFSPAAVNLAKRLPATNDPCGLVTYGVRKPSNERQMVGKVDYQLSDKQSLFGRSVVTLYKQSTPFVLDANVLNTTVLGFDDRAQSYA